MSIQLTVAIPTYNRAAHLERRLQELIPQVQAHPNVALCVFDDASTDSTPQVIERYRAGITVAERSPANRGIGGNMLRAFEAGGTGWLWTVGDDDPVAPNGVATALELIAKTPDALTINCDSEGGRNATDHGVFTIPELLAEKEIADVLFMSSNLYNLAVMRSRFKVLYQAPGTLAPHLAVLLATLENSGRPLVFSTRQLTLFHHREQRWSSLEAALGIAYMPVFIKDPELQQQVAISARAVTRWMLRYGLREVTTAAGFVRWKRYTRTVNRMLASFGAEMVHDFKRSRDGDSLVRRLIPEVFTRIPYWLVRKRALRMHKEHAGDTVMLANSAIVVPEG